ncbi:MAG: peptidylprolyl isomerase, partial [Leptolinea sp.]
MSQSKRKTKAIAKRNTEKKIQIIAGVVILLVIVGIVWMVISSQKSAAPVASLSATSAPASNTSAITPPVAEAAAEATAEVSAGAKKTYPAAPAMTIDKAKKYIAIVKMTKGSEFSIQLYPDKAPITVNSFVFLAREKFFDGTTFHRVLEGFMAQGGDPTGTGSGG